MPSLQGKVTIVTGASTGMGRAIAVALAAEGASLAIVARSADRLEEAANAARAVAPAGTEVACFPGDVGDQAMAKAIVQSTFGRFGRIDILVNNAGTNTFHRNLPDISVEDWNKVLNTNLTGAFLFTRYALRHMRAAGSGQIINISSGAGLNAGPPAGVAYVASKHGMQGLTGSINAEERRNGIRACVICPGEVDTPNLDLRPLPPSPEARVSMLLAEDIANAVAYVATQPERVAVELMVITPRTRRNYAGDYERYLADGHTKVETE